MVSEVQNPGGQSKKVIQYKKEHNLPEWKEVSTEVEALADRYGVDWLEQLKGKMEIRSKYLQQQHMLVELVSSAPMKYVNAVNNAIDLQTKMFELEDKLSTEGKSPLENKSYMRAREMLGKELQFIHKQGLDVSKFKHEVEKSKNRVGDDDMFVVEADE